MAIEPIQFSLSSYNKLSILRKQLDDRTREFEEIEGTIRELWLYVNEVDFLKSISSAYAGLDAKEQIAQISTLEARRNLLHDLTKTLNDLLIKTEQETKSGKGSTAPSAPRTLEKNSLSEKPATTAAPATGSTDPNKKPLSFDEFRKKFPTSGV
mgnify:CR=1 FL=1|jgi:hypothetical protein